MIGIPQVKTMKGTGIRMANGRELSIESEGIARQPKATSNNASSIMSAIGIFGCESK